MQSCRWQCHVKDKIKKSGKSLYRHKWSKICSGFKIRSLWSQYWSRWGLFVRGNTDHGAVSILAGEVIDICCKGKIQLNQHIFWILSSKPICFVFLGRPGEPEGLPERAEQRAAHCCGQKRQVRSWYEIRWDGLKYEKFLLLVKIKSWSGSWLRGWSPSGKQPASRRSQQSSSHHHHHHHLAQAGFGWLG